MSLRFDRSSITSDQQEQLQALLTASEHPFLSDGKGNEIELPKSIYKLLLHVLGEIQQGESILLIPENEEFTTQAAANFLGMSRQYFVTLLENGAIPFHKVGTHRRVHFKDLVTYQEERNQEKKDALEDYFKQVDQHDLYK